MNMKWFAKIYGVKDEFSSTSSLTSILVGILAGATAGRQSFRYKKTEHYYSVEKEVSVYEKRMCLSGNMWGNSSSSCGDSRKR